MRTKAAISGLTPFRSRQEETAPPLFCVHVPGGILRGMRNTVGFDWNPRTKELYFTDNNRDWLSEDLPHGELNRVTKPGKQHFGFPF